MKKTINIGDTVRVRLPLPELRSEQREIPLNATAVVVLPGCRIVEPHCYSCENKGLRPGVYPGSSRWSPALISYRDKIFSVEEEYLYLMNDNKRLKQKKVSDKGLLISLEAFPCIGDIIFCGELVCEVTNVNYEWAIAEYFGAVDGMQDRAAVQMKFFNSSSFRDSYLSNVSVLERGNTWKYWWGGGKEMYFRSTFEEASFLKSVGAYDFLAFPTCKGVAPVDYLEIKLAAKKIEEGCADSIYSGGEIFRCEKRVRMLRFHDRERGERIRGMTLRLLKVNGL